MRDTSIDAYNIVLADGTIADSQKLVYDCLYNFGPLTGREVNSRLGFQAHKRLSELEYRGLATTTGKKTCSESGFLVAAWDVTALTCPGPKPPKKTTQKLAATEIEVRALLKSYVDAYPQSCGCHIHGNENCLRHRALRSLA